MPKKKVSKSSAPSFEQSLARLEAVVEQLENGEVGLDEALAQYEEGVKYLRRCYKLLEQAEQRIELVAGVDSEGKPITRPLAESDDEDDDLGKKRKVRRRRTRQPPDEDDTEMDESARLF